MKQFIKQHCLSQTKDKRANNILEALNVDSEFLCHRCFSCTCQGRHLPRLNQVQQEIKGKATHGFAITERESGWEEKTNKEKMQLNVVAPGGRGGPRYQEGLPAIDYRRSRACRMVDCGCLCHRKQN